LPERHVTCQEIVELVTDYLEHALDSETAAQFEEHINFCDGCEAYLGQVRATIETISEIEPEDVPAETSARLLGAFREWKRS
jgi:predicted anti-sigma-YlaC factor YlaD